VYKKRVKAPNGRRLVKCGYGNDRDVTACINMLRMRGAPFPLKATYEPVAVRLKG
jgi:putative transposase